MREFVGVTLEFERWRLKYSKLGITSRSSRVITLSMSEKD